MWLLRSFSEVNAWSQTLQVKTALTVLLVCAFWALWWGPVGGPGGGPRSEELPDEAPAPDAEVDVVDGTFPAPAEADAPDVDPGPFFPSSDFHEMICSCEMMFV